MTQHKPDSKFLRFLSCPKTILHYCFCYYLDTTYEVYLKTKSSSCTPWRHSRGAEVDSSWNVLPHGDAREGKWRGNWRMEWVTTLHTTSEHDVSNITTADAHTSAASSRLNWRPYRFKWTRPFRRKRKSGFCACAITFQTQSTAILIFTFSISRRW
jgi:hypothetical protein